MTFKSLFNSMMPNKNGLDELTTLNFIILIILLIFDIFINNIYLSLSIVLFIFLIIFRTLSTNKTKRYKENKCYLNIVNKPIKKFKLYKDIIKNYNTSLYKRCPKCKQILKLPLQKGKHNVVCPNCKNKFEVKCNRNEKVKAEVIKNHK